MANQDKNVMTAGQMEEFMKMKAQLDKIKERQRATGERLRAKNNVLLAKARAAGLSVSEREINEELARMAEK